MVGATARRDFYLVQEQRVLRALDEINRGSLPVPTTSLPAIRDQGTRIKHRFERRIEQLPVSMQPVFRIELSVTPNPLPKHPDATSNNASQRSASDDDEHKQEQEHGQTIESQGGNSHQDIVVDEEFGVEYKITEYVPPKPAAKKRKRTKLSNTVAKAQSYSPPPKKMKRGNV